MQHSKMLSHKTAKLLKEAGFPQRPFPGEIPDDAYHRYGYPTYYCEHGNVDCESGPYSCPSSVFHPSLEELIEACGDRFGVLDHFNNGRWGAYVPRDIGTNGIGNTPSEAVAALYLELNKKS